MKNRETYSVGAGIIFMIIGVVIVALTGHHATGPAYLILTKEAEHIADHLPGGDVGLGIAIGAMVVALGSGIVIGARGSRREG